MGPDMIGDCILFERRPLAGLFFEDERFVLVQHFTR
jgi:hypothetical protein